MALAFSVIAAVRGRNDGDQRCSRKTFVEGVTFGRVLKLWLWGKCVGFYRFEFCNMRSRFTEEVIASVMEREHRGKLGPSDTACEKVHAVIRSGASDHVNGVAFVPLV